MRKFLFLLLLLIPTQGMASVLNYDSTKTLELKGIVNARMSSAASIYLKDIAKKRGNAYLIIDSQGGSVTAGLNILRGMDQVKASGGKVICMDTWNIFFMKPFFLLN